MIKEIIAKLKSEIGTDNAEVTGLLSSLSREAETVLSDLNAANSESKKRKLMIRELEQKIEDTPDTSNTLAEKDAEIERLKTFETKWNTSLAEKDQKNAEKWADKAKLFEVEETDPKFKKISGLKEAFKFGDKLSPADISENLKAMTLLEKADAFGIEARGTDFNNEQSRKTTKYKSPFEAFEK